MQGPTTGIPGLDELIGKLRVGDNVVWQAGRETWEGVSAPFLKASRGNGLCYVCVDESPTEVLGRHRELWDSERFVLLDCYSSGLGRARKRRRKTSGVPIPKGAEVRTVEDARDYGYVQLALQELEDELGEGAAYVFESLTGMQKLWGEDAALAFFLNHCPRLYDLRTVAYWFLDPPAHDPAFLQRLHRVTQVVLQVASDGDAQTVRVDKADARRPEITGRTAELRHSKGRLRVAAHAPGGVKASELLRRRRQARGMSQAELARRVGITASALSQAEHDRRGLSEATLSRTWRVLGFDSADSIEQPPQGYVLARRGDRHLSSLATGLEADKIMERPSGFQAEVLSFGPGASGRRPPFATKWPEFVIVNEGVLELRVGEAREVLHAGDAMLITGQPLTGWRNPSPTVTRALWVVFAGSG